MPPPELVETGVSADSRTVPTVQSLKKQASFGTSAKVGRATYGEASIGPESSQLSPADSETFSFGFAIAGESEHGWASG